jgi:hypothetical protein
MNEPESSPLDHVVAERISSNGGRPGRRTSAYLTWRENEIVRLELLISRSVAARARLLRVHRTVPVNQLLFANERHVLNLCSALSALTKVSFSLADILTAASDAPSFEMKYNRPAPRTDTTVLLPSALHPTAGPVDDESPREQASDRVC